MLHYKKIVLLVFALLVHVFVFAQAIGFQTASDNTGFMRSEAKIYVVMAVVITILIGLLVYIIRLDRKITRLEKGDL